MNAYDREQSRPAPAPDEAAAETAHPLLDEFRARFRDAPYYSTGRGWADYAPAYKFGLAAQARAGGRRFEDVEADLAAAWGRPNPSSRLAWVEARGAVEDAWRQAELLVRAPGLVPGGAVRTEDGSATVRPALRDDA